MTASAEAAPQHSKLFGVIGYSTRALVEAVTDLGHAAIAIDAFGDQDTNDKAQAVHVVEEWPSGILRAARTCKVDAWLLGGGMENCELVCGVNASTNTTEVKGELEKLAPVLGPNRNQMNRLRSPAFWESLGCDGIHWPSTSFVKPSDDLSRWLVKPLRSAGGLAVRSALESSNENYDCLNTKPIDTACYWQRKIEGRVLGVTWVMREGGSRLLGITQSLGQHDWPGPSEFIYRGSFGPIALLHEQLCVLENLGERVAGQLPEYRGYLQADVIEDRTGRMWLLEFNPRWTAGMEILHETAGSPAGTPLGEHLQAWGIDSATQKWRKPPTKLVSKAIYYSATDIELDMATRRHLQSLRCWQDARGGHGQWCIADVPSVTEPSPMRLNKGTPILTLKCRRHS